MNQINFDFSTTLGLLLLIVLASSLIGIILVISNRNSNKKDIITGLALGITLFLFVDNLEGSTMLGIDFGLTRITSNIILVLIFSITIITLIAIETNRTNSYRTNKELENKELAIIFALIFIFHSMAEGIIIGHNIQFINEFSISNHGIQSLSFGLHKLGEAVVISTPFLFIRTIKLRDIIKILVIIIIPGIIFTYLGYQFNIGNLITYLFAITSGGLVYLIIKITQIMKRNRDGSNYYLGVLLGILFIYLSGFLHSIGL